jgi:hypothetical protein
VTYFGSYYRNLSVFQIHVFIPYFPCPRHHTVSIIENVSNFLLQEYYLKCLSKSACEYVLRNSVTYELMKKFMDDCYLGDRKGEMTISFEKEMCKELVEDSYKMTVLYSTLKILLTLHFLNLPE